MGILHAVGVDRSERGQRGPTVPWVESPFFGQELAACQVSDDRRALAEAYHRDGFVVLRDIFDPELIASAAAEVDVLFSQEAIRAAGRAPDAWEHKRAIRAIAISEPILETLRFLYGRAPVPFQTLNFLHGSEQRGHADSIHFSSLPERYMCGVWVALEDVGPENGPLFYYPGSHKLPVVTPYDLGQTVDDFDYAAYEDFQESLMETMGYRPVEFHARKGDVLIWSSNIVHGGRAIAAPGSTRRSQVTHCFFQDCLYYTPMFSDMVSGEYFLRTTVADIRTRRPVRQTYDGRPVRSVRLRSGRSRVTVEPTRADVAAARAREVLTGLPESRARLRGLVGRNVRRYLRRSAR